MRSLVANARFMMLLLAHWRAQPGVRPRAPQLARLAPYRRVAWGLALGVIGCALLTYPVEAGAISIFDRILTDAQGRQAQWFVAMRDAVRPTFMILGTIEICWAAAIWAFEKDSLNSFAVEVIKKIMTIGFFFVLLENAADWIPRIFGTFEAVGLQVADMPRQRLTTDGIVTMGIKVAVDLWSSVKTAATLVLMAPLQIMGTTIPGVAALHAIANGAVLLALITAAVIVVSHVIVAAQFFCLKLESVILFATGAIFLGMGSSSWTRDYVNKYLNYAINVGVRLLVLIFILSITLGRLVESPGRLPNLDLEPIVSLLAASILQAILAMKAPELAGALLSGGSALTAGSVTGAVGGAFRNVAATAAVAVNTGKALSNLAKAAKAGTSSGKGGGPTVISMAPPGMGAQSGGSSPGAAISGLGGTSSRPAPVEGPSLASRVGDAAPTGAGGHRLSGESTNAQRPQDSTGASTNGGAVQVPGPSEGGRSARPPAESVTPSGEEPLQHGASTPAAPAASGTPEPGTEPASGATKSDTLAAARAAIPGPPLASETSKPDTVLASNTTPSGGTLRKGSTSAPSGPRAPRSTDDRGESR